MKSEFGIRLPVSGPFASAASIARIAQEAERLGFDAVLSHDHVSFSYTERYHFSSGVAEKVEENEKKKLSVTNFYEAMNTLAYVAAITKRVKLVPAAFVVPWRHPVLFAKQCATLQEFALGRFVCAVCIGNIASDFRAMNVPYEKRGRLMSEALDLLKILFSSDKEVKFEGKYFKCDVAPLNPKPKNMPIWIAGGHNELSYERVAKYGEGFFPGGGTLQQFQDSVKGINAALERHGRKGSPVAIGRQTFLCLAKTSDEARRLSKYTIEMFFHGAEFEQNREGRIQQALRTSLIGSVDDVIHRIEEFQKAGLTFTEMRLVERSLDDAVAMMKLFADQVLPSFR